MRPGKEHAGKYGLAGLWELLDALPRAARPHLVRGDCNCGTEETLRAAEAGGLAYLFKLRQTKKAKALIRFLETQGGWRPVGLGWLALMSPLSMIQISLLAG